MNFVAIDFETANSNRSSPCSLGISLVENSEIVLEKEWLIKPYNNHYNQKNIEIHNITPEMTINEPEFYQLWDEIKPYLENKLILAHNANNMEYKVLKNTLELYKIPFNELDFQFVDTLSLSKSLFSWLKDYKLSTICRLLGISFNQDYIHNSLYDANLTAKLGIKIYENFTLTNDYKIDFEYQKNNINRKASFFNDEFENLKERKISSELKIMKTDLIDKSHFFYQKKVVITGIFNNYPIREEMAKLLHDVGADINTSISKKTDIVVIGEKAGPKKLEQISSFNIKTITEEEFINIFPYEKQ